MYTHKWECAQKYFYVRKNTMAEKKLHVKRMIMFWAKVLIIAVQIAMFAYLWYNHYKDLMPIQYWRRGNWAVIGLYGLILLGLSKSFESLKVGYLKTWDVMYNSIFSILMTNGIMYIVLVLINGDWAIFKGMQPKFENASPMFLLCLIDFIVTLVWAVAMRWVYAVLYPPQEMLLIYGDVNPDNLLQKLGSRSDRYIVKNKMSIAEGMDRVISEMKKYDSVIIGDISSHERNQLLKVGFENNIRCYGIPKLSDIMIRSAENIDLFDTPILLFRNSGLSDSQRVAKRIMDIVVSIIALIPASIIMLVIAIAIYAYDKGPIFYKQIRLTRDGKPFEILKFRSMIVESEKRGAVLAKADDDRITPVGKVIRRLHFDELPQLFNILGGSMSVVGPRPERPDIAAEYKEVIPEFDFRLKVKAGLTGYAQVYGQYNTKPYDKLKLDLTYIENYSFWLDIKLMILTIKILFWKEKSEGVDNGQDTAL